MAGFIQRFLVSARNVTRVGRLESVLPYLTTWCLDNVTDIISCMKRLSSQQHFAPRLVTLTQADIDAMKRREARAQGVVYVLPPNGESGHPARTTPDAGGYVDEICFSTLSTRTDASCRAQQKRLGLEVSGRCKEQCMAWIYAHANE